MELMDNSPSFRSDRSGSLTNQLEVMHHPHLHQFIPFELVLAALTPILFDLFDCPNDVPEPERIIPHNGIASFSTLSLTSLRRIGLVATSTCLPRSSSSSYERPPRSKRVLPGSSVTRKSISLFSVAFLFATEPNTLMSRTPYRSAILLISLLFSFRSSYTSISHHHVRCKFTPLTT